MVRTWLVSLLLACGSQPDDPARGDRGGPAPAPTAPAVEPVEPFVLADVPYDREAVEATLQHVVDAVVHVSADPAIEVYDAVMARQTETCPEWLEVGTESSTWVGDCLGDGGASYVAKVTRLEADDERYVNISGTMTADGVTLAARGRWTEAWDDTPPSRTWTTKLHGPALATGDGLDDTWLTAGWLTTDLTVTRGLMDGSPGVGVTVTGDIGGLDAPLDAVSLDLELDPAVCAEPGGTAAVRVPPGHWFELRFDAVDCDGCGPVWFRDQQVGEACVDFGGWQSWTWPGGVP